jgi:hypothetical protein
LTAWWIALLRAIDDAVSAKGILACRATGIRNTVAIASPVVAFLGAVQLTIATNERPTHIAQHSRFEREIVVNVLRSHRLHDRVAAQAAVKVRHGAGWL